jgi:MtN3 and saliva related transmembrane protein
MEASFKYRMKQIYIMEWYLVGIAAAFLTTFGFVPQIIKMKRARSANNVSIVTLYQFSAGVILWILYGFYLQNIIIMVANSITLITLAVAITFYDHYSKIST